MRPLLCVAAVLLAQAASAEKILIGQLSTLAHSVSGEVYALDEKTLMIKDFNYDGAGDNTREHGNVIILSGLVVSHFYENSLKIELNK